MARTTFAGASLFVIACGLTSAASAQDARSTAQPSIAAPTPAVATPDDIIVTATKRPQTLQDVPVSVAVTSAQTIERAQIRDFVDLQSVVPSLKVVQGTSVAETNFFIRGFGNGAGNVGIEGSVGVFIDGV